MEQIRQGDLLLIRVDEAPSGESRVQGRSVTLAEGEKTGHAHVLTLIEDPEVTDSDKEAVAALFDSLDGATLLSVPSDAKLEHQEHSTATIAPGTYKVIRQREAEGSDIRTVQD